MTTSIKNKIDFAIIIGVNNANPNGDPLNANRPRQTIDRLGEISDVCIKRKIRNRLLAMGEEIFVQSDDNRSDDCRSLKARFDQANISPEQVRERATEKWLDVRAFGQLFAFKAEKKKGNKSNAKRSEVEAETSGETTQGDSEAVSIGIRGPVTVQSAYSLKPIVTESMQITKSVNLETNVDNPDKKDADTMGMKHRVSYAVYVACGAISPQLAMKTGFSDDDGEKIKLALQSLFEGDASSARPEGSMEVLKVVWCKHTSSGGQYSSANVHRTIRTSIDNNGRIAVEKVNEALKGLAVEFLDALEGDDLDKVPRRS